MLDYHPHAIGGRTCTPQLIILNRIRRGGGGRGGRRDGHGLVDLTDGARTFYANVFEGLGIAWSKCIKVR
jgi:hypothetical protein